MTAQAGDAAEEFFNAALELSPDEVSPPTKTQFGWHLIQGVDPVVYTPLSEVEETIREQLVTPKKNEAMETWVEETRRKYSREVVYAVGFKPAETTETTTTQPSSE